MKIGQMAFNRKSHISDFIQLDMCGIDKEAAILKFNSVSEGTTVILHGDWTKKGASENNIVQETRIQEYIDVIEYVKSKFDLVGITVHPPFKSKVPLTDFLEVVNRIELQTGCSIFIENRSNHKIHFSKPNEVVELTNIHSATIDIPQLYIACEYNEELFYETLTRLNWQNVEEIHLANLKRDGTRSYVGRKLNDSDGVLDIPRIVSYIKEQVNPYFTLEILGGVPTFETQSEYLRGI